MACCRKGKMGCGCGKGKNKGLRNAGNRPIVTPRQASTNRGVASGPSPSQIQALQMQNQSQANSKGLDSQRRELERKRRNAITKRILGK